MKHSIARITAHETDYKLCIAQTPDFSHGCGRLNWYENEECVGCGYSEFKPATKEDVVDFGEDFALGFDEDTSWSDIFAEVA